jgi:hypothetical protein
MQLHIEFGRTQPLEELPPRSIALDGYVRGPVIDTEAQRYSFDHHDHCIRHVTSASCVQVLDALIVGFDPRGYTVYVNDIDADTVLSVYLLQHPDQARHESVRTLVEGVGKIDAHGPAYKLNEPLQSRVAQYLELVLQPERELRRSGAYGQADLAVLLDECLDRTARFLGGTLELPPLKPGIPYRILFSLEDLALIEGDREMMGRAYTDGWNKLIAMLPAKDGSRAYTISKRSEFIPFDVCGLLQALHAREPGWGGGSTVGGAPRNPDGTRSKLAPEEVWAIAKGFVV